MLYFYPAVFYVTLCHLHIIFDQRSSQPRKRIYYMLPLSVIYHYFCKTAFTIYQKSYHTDGQRPSLNTWKPDLLPYLCKPQYPYAILSDNGKTISTLLLSAPV